MIGRVVGVLRGRGLRKGVLGGDRRWFTIWAILATAHTVHKLTKAKPVVERITLKPGETITISDLGAPESDL